MNLWSEYSRKAASKIEFPKSVGSFAKEEAEARRMRAVVGRAGGVVELSWLVDPEDGMIVDARFLAFGETALIAAAEAASEMVIHKYYDQARRLSAELLDKHLRDKSDVAALPASAASALNLVVDALDEAAEGCNDIPLPKNYVSPLPHDVEVVDGGYPGFETFTIDQKLKVIEDVIKEDIRPYIEMDGGGIEVINLNNNEVIIAYQGNCTSCFSSTGATLSYIQQTLRAKVHPALSVTPSM